MENLNAVEILLVEDNPHDTELILRALRKNKLSRNVLIVTDGVEALDFFFCRGKFEKRDISNPPKVVLLDLKLPKVSGIEVLKAVKADKRTARIPIVILTSSNQEADKQEAYDSGANSYVVKPIDFEQFINSISSLGLYWLLVNEPLK